MARPIGDPGDPPVYNRPPGYGGNPPEPAAVDVTTSRSYSTPIPVVFGQARVPAKVIVQGGIRVLDKTTNSAFEDVGVVVKDETAPYWHFKNAKGAAVTLALCEGPVASITDKVFRGSEDPAALSMDYAASQFKIRILADATGNQITVPLVTAAAMVVGDGITKNNDHSGGWLHITDINTGTGVITLDGNGSWDGDNSTQSSHWKYAYRAPKVIKTVSGGTGGIVTVQFTELGLPDGKIPEDLTFEVVAADAVSNGDGTYDAHPADVLVGTSPNYRGILTNTRWGLGWDPALVDLDHGPDGNTASSFRQWCTSAGLKVSGVILEQNPAMDYVASLLAVCMSEAVVSGDKFTAIPWSDKTLGSYVPDTTVKAIDAATECADEEEPVTFEWGSDTDVCSVWPITFPSRARLYKSNTIESMETARVEGSGDVPRRAGATQVPWIISEGQAQQVSLSLAQRAVYQRMTCRVRLSIRHMLLEPMGYFSITDAPFDITGKVFRITNIDEDGDDVLTVEGREWPTGVAVPPVQAIQPALGTGFGGGYGYAEGATAVKPDLSNLPAGQIPRDKATSGQDFDNCFPNGTSESDLPSGADATSPEFWGRVNVGTGSSFSGDWIRRISVNDTMIAADYSSPPVVIPCSPGHSFYFQAQALNSIGSHSPSKLRLRFKDQADATLQTTESPVRTAGTWALLSVLATAPAATTNCEATYLTAYDGTEGASGNADFDALYLRRIIDAPVVGVANVAITAATGWSVNYNTVRKVGKSVSGTIRLDWANSNAAWGHVFDVPAGAGPAGPNFALAIIHEGGTTAWWPAVAQVYGSTGNDGYAYIQFVLDPSANKYAGPTANLQSDTYVLISVAYMAAD